MLGQLIRFNFRRYNLQYFLIILQSKEGNRIPFLKITFWLHIINVMSYMVSVRSDASAMRLS